MFDFLELTGHFPGSSVLSILIPERGCRAVTTLRMPFSNVNYAVQKNAMFPGATIIAFLYLCCHNAASVSSLAKISAMFAHRRHNLAFRPLKNSLCFSNSSAILSSSSLLMTASSMLRLSIEQKKNIV